MADFCRACSIEIFCEDFGDLKGLGNGKTLTPDCGWVAICEGCGYITVNDEGECQTHDHSKPIKKEDMH